MDDNQVVRCPSCGCELHLLFYRMYGYTYAGAHATDCYVGVSRWFETPEAALAAAQKRWVEPNRVLTLESVAAKLEADAPVYLEIRDWAGGKWHGNGDDTYEEVEDMTAGLERRYPDELDDEYGQTWRCWLRKPTDEERAAVPWEGEKHEAD